ncbi:MAG: TlpA family protein disulfide reductase [Bryobacterales bacterium]|nr:TlpA family protein disulfide reductase [Bryobacteraceae bacterium]MDW8130462.1 TlpA family protein disulfide reductase [Bryobacterales bacterium]
MTRRGLLIVLLCAAGLSAQPRLIPLDAPGYRKLIAENRGQILLVNFWATWCEPCLKELPELVKLHRRLAGRFRLITVSADEAEQEAEARKILAKFGVPGPHYIKRPGDEDAFIRSVDPSWSGALPALFLYDRQGRRVRSFVGETEIGVVEAGIRKLP